MKICLFCFVCYLLPVGAFGVQELIDTVIYHNEMIKYMLLQECHVTLHLYV